MPLSGKQDEVRDIFLVGCYTCQRVSDYSRIKSEDFTTTAKGTPIIRIVQQKTKTEVKIPIMNPNLRVICEKYNYRLPYVVITHTTRRSGITNMYLSHKYTILQMMSVSGHKTQKTFMDYIKLSS